MDTDFVNIYIQKQSQLINELTSKNLMVETKFQLLEERYKDLVAQHTALVESIERAKQVAEQNVSDVDQPLEPDFVDGEPTESQF